MSKTKKLISPLNFKESYVNSNYLVSVKQRSYGLAVLPTHTNLQLQKDFNFVYNNENLSLKGEIALWRAVILQAGIDLTSKSKKKIAQTYRWKAFQWFNLNNKEFITVCNYAGLDPKYVYEKMKTKKDEAVEFMTETINNAKSLKEVF